MCVCVCVCVRACVRACVRELNTRQDLPDICIVTPAAFVKLLFPLLIHFDSYINHCFQSHVTYPEEDLALYVNV